jgi:hypothetical protein
VCVCVFVLCTRAHVFCLKFVVGVVPLQLCTTSFEHRRGAGYLLEGMCVSR